MKTRLISLFCLSLLLLECSNKEVPTDTPTCVRNLIDQYKQQPVTNPPARVYRYTYQGRTVYFIPQRCCDIASLLYDESCTLRCSPDGGISGGGDGRCTDFFATRTNEVLIWKDTRK
ncbi:DUF6970 domain-containing protein [Spirosoma montaniterrae]|uniref:DUF6970 domain-containing protein n=1 Tax=Spirosoma montaniterrae TaxID=1178516 RepID=UPI00097D1682|nr:hypothetical protein [Spirosoma montaniterrae]